MDIIDNVMYATYMSGISQDLPTGFPPQVPQPAPAERIVSAYVPAFLALAPPPNVGSPGDPVYSFDVPDKMDFCALEDPEVIERSVKRHWYDIDAQVNYTSAGVTQFGPPAVGEIRFSSFGDSSTYHLMYAYLIENTRILQIFQRLLEKYYTDEEFGISNNNHVLNWMSNTEALFFSGASGKSMVKGDADARRRNAYWRMFGMDLAFGDIAGTNAPTSYHKAKISNQQFIVLFERYLSEIWQSFTNANNTSGVNSTDLNIVVDLAMQLRELMQARRGDPGNTYSNMNLSKEEFSSVLITSWFAFIISVDTPVVNFLNCQSSTIGDRLQKIGNKVGVPAHSKCQALFEMACSASNILRIIEEGGRLDNAANMMGILRSLIPPTPVFPTPDMNVMTDFLTVINNWERATGHRIKHTELNVNASVKVRQNGMKQQVALN